ncbi:hypothetical protein [Crenobacter cavernae]|uniref:DUF5666 domain-containing protein n=1 Tax=Crenobacter cavernae TaxID=2290923 RepID=A0ABY0FEA1_9NEIS|nr:hypothetical protein [Crenobacter cavernae]RXZ44557.1 hypothetical protein EBB06_05515 [Crenobacter cavernae]
MQKFLKFGAVTLFALCASSAVLAAEPAKNPAPAKGVLEVGVKQAVFSVKAIDLDERLVTIGDADGNKRVVAVGKDVKNLDKLQVGQKVRITGSEALLVALHPAPGAASTAKEVVEKTTQTLQPGKPNLKVERTVTQSVTVEAVDLKRHVVTLKTRTGEIERFKVRTPALQAKLKNLKAGDVLDVGYRRAVAVKVLPTT